MQCFDLTFPQTWERERDAQRDARHVGVAEDAYTMTFYIFPYNGGAPVSFIIWHKITF